MPVDPLLAALEEAEASAWTAPGAPPEPVSAEIGDGLGKALEGRYRFTEIGHPSRRLLGLFRAQVLTGPGLLPRLRAEMAERFGPLATVARADLTAEGARRHARAVFAAYLDAILAARAGDGRHPLHPGWLSQAETVRALRRAPGLDRVMTRETPRRSAVYLTERLGVEIKGRSLLDAPGWTDLDPLLTPEIEDRILGLHAEDFERFGYVPLTAQTDAGSEAPDQNV